jgi:hypothetical protein
MISIFPAPLLRPNGKHFFSAQGEHRGGHLQVHGCYGPGPELCHQRICRVVVARRYNPSETRSANLPPRCSEQGPTPCSRVIFYRLSLGVFEMCEASAPGALSVDLPRQRCRSYQFCAGFRLVRLDPLRQSRFVGDNSLAYIIDLQTASFRRQGLNATYSDSRIQARAESCVHILNLVFKVLVYIVLYLHCRLRAILVSARLLNRLV